MSEPKRSVAKILVAQLIEGGVSYKLVKTHLQRRRLLKRNWSVIEPYYYLLSFRVLAQLLQLLVFTVWNPLFIKTCNLNG